MDPNGDPNGGYCKYVIQGKPSCLVGRILHQLGYDIKSLDGSISLAEIPGLSKEARAVLAAMQRAQDYGITWYTALRIGESVDVALCGS